MSFIEVAGLAIRLFSLWLFLFSLQALGVAHAVRGMAPSPLNIQQGALVLAPTIIAFGLSIFLWRFPLAVARLLIPRVSDAATTITLREAWQLASVMLGFIILSSAGPLLLESVSFLYLSAKNDFGGPSPERKVEFVSALIKTAFGLFLVFGNKHIYRRFGALH